MVLFKRKLLMEQLQDITGCINKVNKLLQIQLLVFLLGQEDYFIELSLIKIISYKDFQMFYKEVLLKQYKKAL
jgi:hypothetical protein